MNVSDCYGGIIGGDCGGCGGKDAGCTDDVLVVVVGVMVVHSCIVYSP